MSGSRKLISLVSPCYNEEANVEELYRRVCNVLAAIPQYDFEYVFIDNASTDNTVGKLKYLASIDPRVKIIVNNRNFGHIRSPYWGLLQTGGEATILLVSDLQDPPELIPQFIDGWEHGYKLVLAVKPVSQTNRLVHLIRKLYYRGLDLISEVPIVKDTTGFGLYDRAVLDALRMIDDPYPYLRGLICELGYPVKTVSFNQPRRLRGVSKNNFYTLYDMAMLGIVSHSVVPLRLAAFFGFASGLLSILLGIVYIFVKLIFWSSFPLGIAPIVIGMFFMFGILLLFIGILGEYVASIHTYVRNRPVVVEKERINFDRT